MNRAIGRFTRCLDLDIDGWFGKTPVPKERHCLLSFDEFVGDEAVESKGSEGGEKSRSNTFTFNIKKYVKRINCLVCQAPSETSVKCQ